MTTRQASPPADIDLDADALENVRAAAAVQVPPWAALVSALASARPEGIGGTIDWLIEHRAALEATYDASSRSPLGLARLAPDLCYEPELAGLDRARNDHLLRGRYLFRDLVGQRSFFQAAVLAITGIDLPEQDALLLEQMGVANLAADRRAWPLAVARRIAAHGGSFAAAVTGGTAVMDAQLMGSGAGAGVASFLHFLDAEIEAGKDFDAVMDGVIARREKVLGFGRPVVGPDERVPPVQALMRRFGRDQGKHVTRVRRIEARLFAAKGLQSNVGAWIGAVMCDLGFTPDGVHAMCNIYLAPCIYAQAAFSAERGVPRTPAR